MLPAKSRNFAPPAEYFCIRSYEVGPSRAQFHFIFGSQK